MSVGELLFEFAGEALLDFVEVGEQWDGHEDYDGALAMADLKLASGLDLERSKSRLEIWSVVFEFVESGCNSDFGLVRVSSRWAVGHDLSECGLRHLDRASQFI